MSTVKVSELESFIDNHPISLKDELLYSSPKGGGFKELLFGGDRLFIVVEGSVYNMKYEVKEKVGIKISEDTHLHLQTLSNSILSSTRVDTKTVSYEAEEPYSGFWTRGKIIGHDTEFFTRVYKRTDDNGNYEELSLLECPRAFHGYACLEVRGIFFMNLPYKKGVATHLMTEVSEFVIEDENVQGVGGSRILKLLGGTLNQEPKTIKVEEPEEEFLW
eukprot:TRINITY_DN11738_c0_g1_i1.p1 TRINITY_DN11738_c0_g1~~TRINITY_DN11738_c0_g1_i1.p1  ORF type:complete len:218 (+),score=47.26 TRINITY_DN11738_c0_g1_i1:16-669(+)